jgi:hypothetical protein
VPPASNTPHAPDRRTPDAESESSMPFTRRELLVRGASLALGAVALTVPEVFFRPPWSRLAAAQTLPTIEANFVAAVEAVTSVADEATAHWILREFDRALPPLPDRVAVTAAVSAVLDAKTVEGGHAPTFFSADADQRRLVLASMVQDPEPDIRQIANQLIPFCAYGYWCDGTLDEPAQPGGRRLERWDAIGFPGPSHGYADTYTHDGPPGFAAMTGFDV